MSTAPRKMLSCELTASCQLDFMLHSHLVALVILTVVQEQFCTTLTPGYTFAVFLHLVPTGLHGITAALWRLLKGL